MLLPYSLGSSLASMPAAWFMNYRQVKKRDVSGQRFVIVIGLAVATLGFGTSPSILQSRPTLIDFEGLLQLLHHGLSVVAQSLIPLIAGIGLGALFHAPYQVFACSLPSQDLAAATSAFFLVRFTGATVGLVRSRIFSSQN